MLRTELRRPDAFVFVSRSFEFSRLTKVSTIALRLRQIACTDLTRAPHLVFERLRSINTFLTFSSFSFSSLLRFVLLVNKTNSSSKMSNTLAINDDFWQPCSMTRLTPCGTYFVYGILRCRIWFWLRFGCVGSYK